MDTFTREHFDRLSEIADSNCVSLLMPTHTMGRETRQDPIRFKNLLDAAEELLTAAGSRPAEARDRLAKLRELINDGMFWKHQEEGLAVYCLPGETHGYTVPYPVPEIASSGRYCRLVPLVPTVSEDSRFYVLALSPKQVRLLEGTRFSAREVDLPGWPDDFEELMAYIDSEAQLQFHTEAQTFGRAGDRAAMFHGHPGMDESSEQKQRLLEFCRLIDDRLLKAVGRSDAPLVLACNQRLASIYHETSDYSNLVDETLEGNPDDRKPGALCTEAWEPVRSKMVDTREVAVDRCGQALGAGQAVSRLEDVLAAAAEGRIETLLVADDAERWGQYDLAERRMDMHEQASPGDEELLNMAAVLAYRNGARLYIAPQDEVPGENPLVAVLRY